MNNRISHLFQPWSAINGLNDVDDILRRVWSQLEDQSGQDRSLNVWQNDQEAIIELDLPGFDLEDVELSIEGPVVNVKATPKARTLDDGVKARVVEHQTGVVDRTIRLGFEIQTDQAEATLRSGILTLRLPRSEAQKPKRIAINAG